ncbi:MAG: hypothetical protein WDZ29_08335 [Balneolaceae bacterium]
MIARLIYLNWKLFLSRLSRFQTLLIAGYALFLLVLLFNLMGTALVIIFLDSSPQYQIDLPWLTEEIHQLILLTFANVFWLLHFSFTSTRLLNIEENRKLLAFGYPAGKLAWHLNLMTLYHPVNVIYNLTWLIFLAVQVSSVWNIPVLVAVVLLNYGVIFSIKHRFLQMVERRFRIVVFSILFVLLGSATLMAVISRQALSWMNGITLQISEITELLYYLPGGLIYWSATYEHSVQLTLVIFGFTLILTLLIFRDHYYKTLEGLLSPDIRVIREHVSRLWAFLRRWLGPNAGKYIYHVMTHPYNRLQVIAIVLIPIVYIPLLLYLDYSEISNILIPTILAALPVALLAMGGANMFGYENREFLLHMQFPISFEQQLKERFLGAVTIPLFIFYAITIFEILRFPFLGEVLEIYIANTFFFLCFMMVFLWSSFYQFQRVSYSTFSFKHPIIPQKVTFTITFAIFVLGYTVFVPLGSYQSYRLYVMLFLIAALGTYLWKNFSILVDLYRSKILGQLWNQL